jgi:hypothetical protein
MLFSISIWINLYSAFVIPLFAIVCLGLEVSLYIFKVSMVVSLNQEVCDRISKGLLN